MRFSFGKNWLNFLKKANADTHLKALESIKNLIELKGSKSGSFLDVGCGSGIFSLSAKNLNLDVVSFDFDKYSVQATQSLKDKHYKNDKNWEIMEGSILDKKFTKIFEKKFDYVYSWGVLHHTGNMNLAFENISNLTKQNGYLIISIYHDQGLLSKYWLIIKKLYNFNFIFKILIIIFHFPYFMILRPLKKLVVDKVKIDSRGMIFWYDFIDWLGGYPFEVAKPNLVIEFFKNKNFILKKLISTNGKLGCNEFIFQKNKE